MSISVIYHIRRGMKKKDGGAVVLIVGILGVLSILLVAYLMFDTSGTVPKRPKAGTPGMGDTAPGKDKMPQSAETNKEGLGDTSRIDIVSSTNPIVGDAVKKVFQHIYLPSGDVQVQIVVKPEELRKIDPVFYQFAQEGDNILFYTDRAILYNPRIDKVIDVSHAVKK